MKIFHLGDYIKFYILGWNLKILEERKSKELQGNLGDWKKEKGGWS